LLINYSFLSVSISCTYFQCPLSITCEAVNFVANSVWVQAFSTVNLQLSLSNWCYYSWF
jgi:hypothetical protein